MKLPKIDFKYVFGTKLFKLISKLVLLAAIILAVVLIVAREEPGKIMKESDMKLAKLEGQVGSLEAERKTFNEQKATLLAEIGRLKGELNSIPVPATAKLVQTITVGKTEYVPMDEYLDLFNAKTFSSDIVSKFERYVALDKHTEDNHEATVKALKAGIEELKKDRDRLYKIATRRWNISVGLTGGYGLSGPFIGIGGMIGYRVK